MSQLFEIDYEIIQRNGKALVSAECDEEALKLFNANDECVQVIQQPQSEIIIKRVTKRKSYESV